VSAEASSELTRLGVRACVEGLLTGEVTASALTEATLAAIERANPELNAFVTVDAEAARRAAAESDAYLASRPEHLRSLEGVPIAVKDIILTKGLRTTACSRILGDFVPPYDATVVARLRAAGAVIIGKTNCDEFAMGSSNENSAFGAVRNPWDPARIPGGSSGGSAVAVAADLCAASLGTDTGGSIRQPASHSGVVGLKPTYGRVSRYGVVAFASSLDQVGPMAKSVDDCAWLFGVLAGHDPKDSTSARLPGPRDLLPGGAGAADVRGLRLGVPREYFVAGADPEVERCVRDAIARLGAAGAELVDISLPHTEYAVSTYYLVATAEASSNLARYDGVRYGARVDAESLDALYARTRWEGFGAEVKRRIMLGTFVLSAGYYDAYYRKAQRVRTLIRRDFEAAFGTVDAIVTPVAPTPAFGLGEKVADPLSMYLADIYTIPCNLAGLPGLSVPAGLTAAGLPVGLQILGKPWDEATVLRVGAAWENVRGALPPCPYPAAGPKTQGGAA
jgi:aspartyl-tRNA(Asn)/glutamyl-tRNA(Gln) amidotransferase subunit A